MKTDFETLKALASYTVNFLKEDNIIDFKMDKRLELIDAMATEFGVGLATDDDIQQQAIEEVEEKMGLTTIPDDITESEMFNHAKKEIIKSFNGESVAGLYLVESLNNVGTRIKDFVLDSDLVEDVFGSDEEIVNYLVKKIRGFTQNRA